MTAAECEAVKAQIGKLLADAKFYRESAARAERYHDGYQDRCTAADYERRALRLQWQLDQEVVK